MANQPGQPGSRHTHHTQHGGSCWLGDTRAVEGAAQLGALPAPKHQVSVRHRLAVYTAACDCSCGSGFMDFLKRWKHCRQHRTTHSYAPLWVDAGVQSCCVNNRHSLSLCFTPPWQRSSVQGLPTPPLLNHCCSCFPARCAVLHKTGTWQCITRHPCTWRVPCCGSQA